MWVIPLSIMTAVTLLATRKASASVLGDDYSSAQKAIMTKVKTEALRQGVPVELALATADLESRFVNVQNKDGGQSYGPMQVNVVNLRQGETLTQLKNVDFNIKRGVEIIKSNLKKAQGNSYKARVLYFCGSGMCGGNPPKKLTDRWNEAVRKWNIAAFYPGFTS